MELAVGSCNACGATGTALMKHSLGRDFFSRPYDRLSPSADQNPKWYCEHCSMHKNLQRDFRDIRAEFDKLNAGQESELAKADELQRASVRLREIVTILSSEGRSPLLDLAEVQELMARMRTMTIPS